MPHRCSSHAAQGMTLSRREALAIFAGLGAVSLVAPLRASAVTSQSVIDAAQMDADEAEAALDEIAQEYATIAGELSKTQAQVVDVTSQIEAKQSEVDAKQNEVDAKQDEVEATQSQIETTQQQIEAKQSKLGDRMAAAYKSGNRSALDLILSSSTFDEFTSNIYYLDKVNESDSAMIAEVKDLKATLETQKTELEAEKVELETQKTELESQKAALEAQKADLVTLQAQQQEQVEEAQAKQAEAQELLDNLNAEVAKLIAQRDAELAEAARLAEEERQAAAASGKITNTTGTTVITGSGSLADVQAAAYTTASTGSGMCAAWVTQVFSNAGVGWISGNACDMYWNYCHTATSDIQAGMIIATPTAPYSSAAVQYGHVGIYLGNGVVRHNASGVVQDTSLSTWVSSYSLTATVLCGWLGGIALS